MRPLASIVCLAIFLPLAGCENGGKRFIFGPASTPAPTPAGVQSAESLVNYLNANASRMQTLRCVDVDGTFQNYGFRAKMMAMKPRNFLMTASALGSPIVDIGSNDVEFWFWSSKAPDPNQYFCTYKDFEDGKVPHFPFPFQPDWIMEALGMGPYGPASKYTVEHDARTIKLIEKTRTPQDRAVRKVIVFNRQEVKEPNPQVQAFLLLDDGTGKEICSAQIQAVQVVATDDLREGVVVPRRMELRVPSDNIRLNLIFSGVAVNTKLDASSFQRQPLQGVQSVDLARGPVGGAVRGPGNAP
jgi:hypothetical protein